MGFQLYRSSPIPPPPRIGPTRTEGQDGDPGPQIPWQTVHAWMESVTDMLNSLTQQHYDVREFGARGDGDHDDTDAIQEAIDKAEAAGGGVVFLSAGTYKTTSTLTVDSSDVWIHGASHLKTTIAPTMTDGSYALAMVPTSGRLNGPGLQRFRIHGQSQDVSGVYMKKVSLGRIHDFEVRSCLSTGLDIHEVWDTHFDNLLVRSCGSNDAGTRATLLRTTEDDGCNRVLFLNSHWESNNGADVWMDSQLSTRGNALCAWRGCKLHGTGGVALGSQPARPHMTLEGTRHSVEGCYFYLCNDDFIDLNGARCDILGNVFNNCTDTMVSISSDYNRVANNNVQNIVGAEIEITAGVGNVVELPVGEATVISDSGTSTFYELYTSDGRIRQIAHDYLSVGTNITRADARQMVYATREAGSDDDVWFSLLPGSAGTNAEVHFHQSGTSFATPNIKGRVRYETDNHRMEFWTNNAERGSFDSAGRFNILSPTAPTSGVSSGVTGDIAWDTSYAYVCTSTDSWSRATLNTF